MTGKTPHVDDMNTRSREVFRQVVEGYLETGDPVGSRTLTRTLAEQVSAATIRNVMQDLEYLGLLDSPHASAGRVPRSEPCAYAQARSADPAYRFCVARA